MTSMGSGVGGNLGGMMHPTARDVETSAWSQVNKERMGLVRDSIEFSFTNVGGNIWNYSADSNRPTLMPMGNLRISREKSQNDDSWKKKFDELVDQLPPSLKAKLIAQYGKVGPQRDADYSALGKTLTLLAKGLSWTETQTAAESNKAEEERTLYNQTLPGRALKGIVGQGRSMLTSAESYLDQTGPNDIHHDQLRYLTKEGNALQGRMEKLLTILSDSEEELPSANEMDKLCEDISSLVKDFNKVSTGSHLQIMGPMLETMEAVAQALSMTPTSPSLFLGFKTALKGIFSSESEAGIFGDDLKALMTALQSGMLAAFMKKMGTAKMKMLMMLLMSALGGAGVLGGLFGKNKKDQPDEDDDKEEQENEFNFVLILDLLESTELIKLIYRIIAQACGQESKTQEETATVMELASLFMMMISRTEGKFDKVPRILQEIDSYLSDKLVKTEKIVESVLLLDPSNSPLAKGLDIALQQAQLALTNQQMDGIINALKGSLEHLNIDAEDLDKDFEKVKQFTELVKYSLGAGLQSENTAVTGMIQAA
jgi:hypothetical protein